MVLAEFGAALQGGGICEDVRQRQRGGEAPVQRPAQSASHPYLLLLPQWCGSLHLRLNIGYTEDCRYPGLQNCGHGQKHCMADPVAEAWVAFVVMKTASAPHLGLIWAHPVICKTEDAIISAVHVGGDII